MRCIHKRAALADCILPLPACTSSNALQVLQMCVSTATQAEIMLQITGITVCIHMQSDSKLVWFLAVTNSFMCRSCKRFSLPFVCRSCKRLSQMFMCRSCKRFSEMFMCRSCKRFSQRFMCRSCKRFLQMFMCGSYMRFSQTFLK